MFRKSIYSVFLFLIHSCLFASGIEYKPLGGSGTGDGVSQIVAGDGTINVSPASGKGVVSITANGVGGGGSVNFGTVPSDLLPSNTVYMIGFTKVTSGGVSTFTHTNATNTFTAPQFYKSSFTITGIANNFDGLTLAASTTSGQSAALVFQALFDANGVSAGIQNATTSLTVVLKTDGTSSPGVNTHRLVFYNADQTEELFNFGLNGGFGIKNPGINENGGLFYFQVANTTFTVDKSGKVGIGINSTNENISSLLDVKEGSVTSRGNNSGFISTKDGGSVFMAASGNAGLIGTNSSSMTLSVGISSLVLNNLGGTTLFSTLTVTGIGRDYMRVSTHFYIGNEAIGFGTLAPVTDVQSFGKQWYFTGTPRTVYPLGEETQSMVETSPECKMDNPDGSCYAIGFDHIVVSNQALTNMISLWGNQEIKGSVNIAANHYIGPTGGTGTVNNSYKLYMGTGTIAAQDRFAIYQLDKTEKNYFAGETKFGIGRSSASSLLDVENGSITVSGSNSGINVNDGNIMIPAFTNEIGSLVIGTVTATAPTLYGIELHSAKSILITDGGLHVMQSTNFSGNHIQFVRNTGQYLNYTELKTTMTFGAGLENVTAGQFSLTPTTRAVFNSWVDIVNGSMTIRGTNSGLNILSLAGNACLGTDAAGNVIAGTCGGSGTGGGGFTFINGNQNASFSTVTLVGVLGSNLSGMTSWYVFASSALPWTAHQSFNKGFTVNGGSITVKGNPGSVLSTPNSSMTMIVGNSTTVFNDVGGTMEFSFVTTVTVSAMFPHNVYQSSNTSETKFSSSGLVGLGWLDHNTSTPGGNSVNFLLYIPDNFVAGSTPVVSHLASMTTGAVTAQEYFSLSYATMGLTGLDISTGALNLTGINSSRLNFTSATVVGINGTLGPWGGTREFKGYKPANGVTNMIGSGNCTLAVRVTRLGDDVGDASNVRSAPYALAIKMKVRQ